MNRALIALAGALVALSGCAPRFIEVEQRQVPLAWVERDVVVHNAQSGSVEFREIVLSESLPVVVGPEERVRWVAGIDVTNSKFQRAGASGNRMTLESAPASEFIVKHAQFPVRDGELSLDGILAAEKFASKPGERLYVEFLHSSKMTEQSMANMMKAWRDLSARLKAKGTDLSNVVLGGNKFDQSVSAIVLVRVGK